MSDHNSQTTSITALMYWIQNVSSVLFKWQMSINNRCPFSIIIFPTLVTWSRTNPRLHPTGQKGLTLKFPTDMNLLQWEYLLTSILYTLDNYNQYNMTYFVAHVTFCSLCSSSRNNDEPLYRTKHHSACEIVNRKKCARIDMEGKYVCILQCLIRNVHRN